MAVLSPHTTHTTENIINKKLILAVIVFVAGCFVVCHTSKAGAHPTVSHTVHVTPAPTTAQGYTDLWSTLSPAEWGGADVSISVPLSATRSVWLYGDTLSDNHGIVNSTAITQDGGVLHISHEGNQLLPQADNDAQGRKVVYWIESARKLSASALEVAAAPTWVSNTGQAGAAWGRTTSQDRTALLSVSESGDVDFVQWTGWVKAPKLDTRFLTVKDGAPLQKEGYLFYGKQFHPEANLASGKALVTICQNRITPAKKADGSTDYAAYRPVFIEH